jgi:DNA-directed RNA polymerase beta' subunit|tara:strand:+ start:208 stop:711 length:504 start_codon:yes stop_codon:yes gene_type:complete
MNWYKSANKITEEDLNEKLKNLIKSNRLFLRLMDQHHVPVEDIDNNLEFKIQKLDGKHAEADAHQIIFNENLFTDNDFFENKLFFFIHEFYHWVRRRSEDRFYFNDPEEVESFALSVAWEILRGRERKDIEKSIYSIVQRHFKNKNKARKMFDKIFSRALKIISQIK